MITTITIIAIIVSRVVAQRCTSLLVMRRLCIIRSFPKYIRRAYHNVGI